VLKDLAREERTAMQAVLEKAVEEYRRKRFLESINSAYRALRSDEPAWAEVERERAVWDQTVADGLTEEREPVRRKRVVPFEKQARRK
jgi:predicted secreted protein